MNNNEPNTQKEGPRVPDAAPRHRHLTPQMRAALNAARSQPLRRVHDDKPGKPPWPAAPRTLYALFHHGHLEGACRRSRNGHPIEEWSITELGREALKPVVVKRHHRPLYLARTPRISYRRLPSGRLAVSSTGGSGDYTSDPRRSIDVDQAPGSRATVAVETLSEAA